MRLSSVAEAFVYCETAVREKKLKQATYRVATRGNQDGKIGKEAMEPEKSDTHYRIGAGITAATDRGVTANNVIDNLPLSRKLSRFDKKPYSLQPSEWP